MIFALVNVLYADWSDCIYGVQSCNQNESCIKTSETKAKCIPHPNELISISSPIVAQNGYYCDQGNLSTIENSHTFNNTAYALDLVSNRKFKAGNIVAVSDGIANVYNECKTKNDQCGNGFGNYVQILRDDGYLFFYAHLEKTLIKNGERVKTGKLIGIEGDTGLTGKDHRHLHFSVHYNWKDLGLKTLRDNIGWLPNSVPFKINGIDSRNLSCTRSSGKIELLKF